MPASKRFTIHRASNVLTLSLKRFANFSGGKITKVSARGPGCSRCSSETQTLALPRASESRSWKLAPGICAFHKASEQS